MWRHIRTPENWASRVTRAAEAGEDLAPDGKVPVPERGAHGGRVCRPRAAAQHLVLGSEEHLGVFAVRERAESGVSGEVGGGPFPDVAQHLLAPEPARSLRAAADRRRRPATLTEVGGRR